MSELFQPIAAEQLIRWVFSELEACDSIFGIPRELFFVPDEQDPFRTSVFGHPLESPFGPAAGPHTQMAQNIVAAWLCGARYIELKTVQTLDELDVPKPCIDMEDEGYNVEWSQELKVHESFQEYLRAWVLIHALHHKLGFSGDSPGIVFNLSVGYSLDGIRQPNVQWFLDQVRDCSADKQRLIDQIARYHPAVRELDIPDCLSDSVTVSTMHGCPPDEIESIGAYLLRERGLHTLVKLNPTLLGPEPVRKLLHEDLKYTDVVVPDAAFEHDLKYSQAVPMLENLRGVAKDCGLRFGVKLSNTLEVENSRTVFDPAEAMMYLSGRPLHVITLNLADRLAAHFEGDLPMSFSAGVDCFNAPPLLAAGMETVTVCSDLLKTGGYLRLRGYLESVEQAFREAGASTIDEFILGSAGAGDGDIRSAARQNMRRYAARTRADPRYAKGAFETSHTKTARALGPFDCIRAPCENECALNQNVPAYMRAVRDGDFAEASRVVRRDNPLPCILGRACDHLCQRACVRTHLDEPLAIRDVKRFIVERDAGPAADPAPPLGRKVAIIGAGPGGMVAAAELARGGFEVEIFEQHSCAGGMVGGVVPEYRLPRDAFERDFAVLERLGVRVHYGRRAGPDFGLTQLRRDGFDRIVIMVGAQHGKKLALADEECDGVLDAMAFLRRARADPEMDLGRRVGVIGAGDTAMDCARVAWRRSDGRVTLIYRRTIDEMPADREEAAHLLAEGIEVLELSQPRRLVIERGRLRALVCRRMVLGADRDASGRRIPREVPDSEFEIPLDTLIVAISQHAVLDFFDGEPIALNDRGYIEVDPVSFETSVPGVYAGGDVANEGPASIVKAAAAGKAIAYDILERQPAKTAPREIPAFDPVDLLRQRARRQWRVPAPCRPLGERRNFAEVVLTYSEQQARAEAARCLSCDAYCSLCAGVCPNLALQTWRCEPFELRLSELGFGPRGMQVSPGRVYRVTQSFQVLVLSDLCNECGNCTTFCPTAGRPYRDKPRLYLERADFEAQADNAFMLLRDADRWSIDARWQGATHRLQLNGHLDYRGPSFHARLDPVSFAIEEAEPIGPIGRGRRHSLEPCAAMFVLLKGVSQSMPFLPTAPTIEREIRR